MIVRPAVLAPLLVAAALGVAGCSSDGPATAPPRSNATTYSDTFSPSPGGTPATGDGGAAIKAALGDCGKPGAGVTAPAGGTVFACRVFNSEDKSSTYLYVFTDAGAQKQFVTQSVARREYGIVTGPNWVVVAGDQSVIDIALKQQGTLAAPVPSSS